MSSKRGKIITTKRVELPESNIANALYSYLDILLANKDHEEAERKSQPVTYVE